MVDQNTRNKLREDNKIKTLIDGVKQSISEAFNNQKQVSNEPVIKSLDKIGQALVVIYNQIKSIKIELPKIYRVTGNVSIDSLPPVEIKNLYEVNANFKNLTRELRSLKPSPYPTSFVVDNFSEIKEYFDSLENKWDKVIAAISKMPAPKIVIPKIESPKVVMPEIKMPKFDIPKATKQEKIDWSPFIDKMEDMSVRLEEAIANINLPEVSIPRTISVDNFPPQMTPNPVTNMNINPLQGIIKTTVQNIGSSLNQIPSYGQLFNRRSVQFYNNSSNTIYYGGSDVTIANGIPVAAGDFSDIIDAGYNMIVYGIAASNGNEIRVIEVASRSEGGVAIQE